MFFLQINSSALRVKYQSIRFLFQIACMKFLNQLVSSTENSNARVYLQYELQLAGHDPESMDKVWILQSILFDKLTSHFSGG